MESCIFCKMIEGKIPTVKVYEDDSCIAIMDKFPLTQGQVLVIGKTHVDYLFDVPTVEYSKEFLAVKKLAKAMDSALATWKCWILVQGMEVAHNHIKILPLYHNKRIPLEEGTGKEQTNEDLEKLASKIKKVLQEKD